jgi:hypothetical protein
MTKMSDNPSPSLLFEDHVDPAAPTNGFHRLFIDTDEKLKMIDHASLVTDFTPSAGGDITTDAAWAAAGDLIVGSGNDTASILGKGAAGGVLSMGNSAVIWNAGTSFPASKATGDRYWRTDLGMEFYWDGTRWVSTTLYTLNTDYVANPTTGVSFSALSSLKGTFGTLWLVDMHARSYVASTNDGSKYWTVALVANSNGSTVSSFTTAGDSINTSYAKSVAIGATSTEDGWSFAATKTSTPGALYISLVLTFRIVTT